MSCTQWLEAALAAASFALPSPASMPCCCVVPAKPWWAMCTRIKTRRIAPVDGAAGSSRSLGMPKRHLEGTTQSDRAKQRQKLGSLRELTVQPATKQRYNRAIDKFLVFLHDNGLRLPNRRDQMDTFACDYLEHLWSTGQGRALASDTIAGLQDQDVRLRGQLPGAWRLLKTWSQHEIPCRAPPLPAHVLHAMVGWAIFHQRFTFAISLLIGFYGMLRTGEIIGLRGSHILSDSRSNKILISLGLTKGGKRHGAAESVVIGYDLAVHFIQHWKTLATPSTPLAVNPGQWRSLFNDSLAALKMSHMNFRPYSLRRGGATWWFSKHHSLDKILLQGRWAAPKTARIYLNEGLSMLAEMVLPLPIPPWLLFSMSFSNTVPVSPSPHLSLLSQKGQGAVERKLPKDL